MYCRGNRLLIVSFYCEWYSEGYLPVEFLIKTWAIQNWIILQIYIMCLFNRYDYSALVFRKQIKEIRSEWSWRKWIPKQFRISMSGTKDLDVVQVEKTFLSVRQTGTSSPTLFYRRKTFSFTLFTSVFTKRCHRLISPKIWQHSTISVWILVACGLVATRKSDGERRLLTDALKCCVFTRNRRFF